MSLRNNFFAALALSCLISPLAADGISNGALFGCGTGMTCTGGTVSSNAVDHITFQQGPVAAVSATKSAFHKFSKASTVDNIEGTASSFTCSVNPTVTVFECGTSTTCASSPTTIGTVTVTAAGTVVDGTINSAAITAGDYVAFGVTAGTCTALNIEATVQTHQN